MKKLLAVFTFLLFVIISFAQNNHYKTECNIPYTSDSLHIEDAYGAQLCLLDIHFPTNVEDFATIVWFHGGGLSGGNKEIPEALRYKGVAVVGVGYRLDPHVEAPAYINDAAAAVAWVFNNIEKYGGSTAKIYVSGHSAGGYLALMVGLDKSYLEHHQIDANKIAGLIPLSGQTITHFTIRKNLNIKDTQPIVDSFAPLYHVRKDAPPLLLITGDREKEMLGRYEENAYLARMMKICGHTATHLIELQGYGHDMTYPAFPLLLEAVKKSEAW